MRLSELAEATGGTLTGGDTEVSGLATDSREAGAGDLFIAIPGLTRNGEDFIPEAVGNGAAAVCSRAPVPGTPTLLVSEPRRALALLAAAFHGYPARALRVIGITGSLGKTSTALLIEQALTEAGLLVGVIGSLGVRFRGDVVHTRMTTPEAPAIHSALAQMKGDGADTVVLEVTSHSLRLERVVGLRLALGILTNLVPDEHLEFHSTPEDYLRTKARFLELLEPGAPLVASADDEHVRSMLTHSLNPPVLVSRERAEDADVWLEDVTTTGTGSEFVLAIRHVLPALAGQTVPALRLHIHLELLGEQQVANAALASLAALLAGASPDAVRAAMANARPIHRRMQVLHPADPMIVDDTVGNAVSIHSLFDTIDLIEHKGLSIVYAVRGTRGATINASNADALAARLHDRDATLIVTSSDDEAGPRDRVSAEELDAVRGRLEGAHVAYEFEPHLQSAVRRAVENAGAGDVVLLLGAQGMDAAGGFVRELLGLERRGSERA